jgi:selenoprotein W-related protein
LYCTGCRWFLRSAYYCQELLLSTFENDINSITLIPSRPPAPGGSFLIQLDDTILWDRAMVGRFPEIKELKKLVRDQINPTKDLGHVDGPRTTVDDNDDVVVEDDESAEEARKFFGVM